MDRPPEAEHPLPGFREFDTPCCMSLTLTTCKIIACRPEITVSQDRRFVSRVYDVVRSSPHQAPHTFQTFLDQEKNLGDWNRIEGQKIQALTQVDPESVENPKLPPPGERAMVAQSITFHPLLVKWHRESQQDTWNEKLFSEVAASNAGDVFRRLSRERGVTIRPVDGLLEASFVRCMFHEFFHLSYFGGMTDSLNGQAYGWHNNVQNKDLRNPDLYAIIAAVLQLRNRDGQKYAVSEQGLVSKL
ncbi:hypothetical protein BDZ85DRAFT_31718 [Elsinoe ampelina]|uniref:Uncharacterized protein n=1 Tax=Elsinoe ampelina TaxID=302913 RepID=A0A6A6G3J1_9PEZI|nr:hypothetical protein BDZ85DRAFT_31718 [Elsinoe ampelina]